MSGQDWLDKDFYATLGVTKDAESAEIKKAYRKLARQWHPDQNPGDTKAEEKFKEIGEAYAVLSDTEQRRQYDALRAMAGGGARFSAGSSAGGPDMADLFSAFTGSGFRTNVPGGGGAYGHSIPDLGDMSDVLSGLFNGSGASAFGARGNTGSPFGPRTGTPRPRKGQDRHASKRISFREALAGTDIVITIDGKQHKVRLPHGVKDGQKIRLRGKGHPGVNGGNAGDLEVTIHVDPHPVFSRDGDDIHLRLPVSFTEAALGAKVEVPLLNGSTVTVKVPAGTQSGARLRVRKRGVETAKKTGDLIIEVQVAVPTDLKCEQKKAIEDLGTLFATEDPRARLREEAKE